MFGAPLLFLLLATATWLVTGAALRPIEELRRGAQEITGTAIAQGRTLPVPEARDEVHSLAVTLNDMLARLEAAQRRQRALVSDAAHELRSPIASIRTQLEVAIDHPEVDGLAADRGRACWPTRSASPGWPRTCWPWPGWTSRRTGRAGAAGGPGRAGRGVCARYTEAPGERDGRWRPGRARFWATPAAWTGCW